MYRLIYSPKAVKAIGKIPREYQKLILEKLFQLKVDPRPRGYDKIVARKAPLYRIRIGDYRAFYFINDEEKNVIIVDILRRTTQTYR